MYSYRGRPRRGGFYVLRATECTRGSGVKRSSASSVERSNINETESKRGPQPLATLAPLLWPTRSQVPRPLRSPHSRDAARGHTHHRDWLRVALRGRPSTSMWPLRPCTTPHTFDALPWKATTMEHMQRSQPGERSATRCEGGSSAAFSATSAQGGRASLPACAAATPPSRTRRAVAAAAATIAAAAAQPTRWS